MRIFLLVVFTFLPLVRPSVADHINIWNRGDANLSGSINLTDIVFLNNFLFSGGPPPLCLDAADADSSGSLNISDPIFLANYLFNGGPQPSPFLVNCPGTIIWFEQQ